LCSTPSHFNEFLSWLRVNLAELLMIDVNEEVGDFLPIVKNE